MRSTGLLLRVPATLTSTAPRLLAAVLTASLVLPAPVMAMGRAVPHAPDRGRLPASEPPATTTLVSKNRDGRFPDAPSFGPVTSADGRFVAFASTASDLVRGDGNDAQDVFVIDRETGTTTRVPVTTGPVPRGGSAGEPSISADGRIVAFTYIAPAGSGVSGVEILAYDRKAGRTEPTSQPVVSDVTVIARQPSVSGDGRFIAFTSNGPGVGGRVGTDKVFRHDRQTRTTIQVSVNPDGRPISGRASSPSISSDGNVVAFVSDGGRSVTLEDPGPGLQVYARDVAAKRTERVSAAVGGGAANGAASSPVLAGNGRYVAFASQATNLVDGPGAGAPGLFRRDRQAGTTIMVSLTPQRTAAQGTSGGPSITPDGNMVAFTSNSQDLAAPQAGRVVLAASRLPSDVFLRDISAAETVLVSVTVDGGSTSGAGDRSYQPAVARGGRYVFFASDSPRMVDGDSDAFVDIFLRDFPPAPAVTPTVPTAEPPAPLVTPAELDLGPIALGAASEPMAAVLKNAGGSPLTVAGASITGADAASFEIVADGCAGRVLKGGEACTVTVVLKPGGPGDKAARLEIRLRGGATQARIELDPPIGPPGVVTIATGSGFPAGATVRLAWSKGLTPPLDAITMDGSGRFRIGVLVFHNDTVGLRDLIAEPADGTAFPPVMAEMRVTQRPVGPPGFAANRRLPGVPPWLLYRR
jgi:Tol biopolymer transport system component